MNKAIQNLAATRDELRVQAHLLKMEAKNDWNELEQKWEKLQKDLEPTKEAASEASQNIAAAHSLLIQEISNGYSKIKEALKS
jgi:hypothetical protein